MNSAIATALAARVVLEEISVERARHLWGGRARNRSVCQAVVDRMASDMKAGRWEINAETIKLDSRGILVDGQHRVAACIASETGFSTFVAYGVDTYCEVDVVRPKSVKDGLVMFDGRKPGPRTAMSMEGALGNVISYGKQAAYRDAPLNLSHNTRVKILTSNPYLDRCLPRFTEEFVVEGGSQGKLQSSPLRPGVALAILWLCEIGEQDADVVSTFLKSVRDGIGLSQGDPAAAYRNMIISSAMRKRQVPHREAFRLGLNAIVSHLAGRKLQIIRPSSSAQFPGAPPNKVLQVLGLEEEVDAHRD
jgi:hypothetical protein